MKFMAFRSIWYKNHEMFPIYFWHFLIYRLYDQVEELVLLIRSIFYNQ